MGRSMRWSSTTTQMRSTTDPRALCGEGMKWGWAWGALLPSAEGRAGRQGRSSEHLMSQDNTGKKSHGDEQCHRNKRGEQCVKAVGEQQEQPMSRHLDIEGAACLGGLSHSAAVWSSGWKSDTAVLRSNKKRLNEPVVLISPFSSSFYFWKAYASVSRDVLCTPKHQMYHTWGKDFQRVTGNTLPPFHNLEIRGIVSKSIRNVFWEAQQATVLFCKALAGFHPWLKSRKTFPGPFCGVQLLQWPWREEFLSDQPGWKPSLWFCASTIITDSPH